MTTNIWRRFLNHWSESLRPAHGKARRQPSRRLCLESLEGRIVPTTRTWTGLGGNGLWANASNWVGSVAPAPLDDLVFPLGASQLSNYNNYAPNTAFKTITLQGGAYSLNGNAISLGIPGVGGSITDNSADVTNLIGFNVVYAGATGVESFNIAVNTMLTFSGQITGATGVSLRKTGAGTVIFGGDNSGYFGPITVAGGALQVQNSNALGKNTTTVLVNAALQVKDVVGAVHGALVVAGAGFQNGGAIENVHGYNTLDGSIKLAGSAILAADAGVLTLSGAIQGAATATLSIGGTSSQDSGKVALTSANAYLGATVVDHGILNLQDPLAVGAATKSTGVTVNAEGALELQLNNGTVAGQKLTLGGSGINNTGALHNISGSNIWNGDILLQSASSIGVDAGSTLSIGAPGNPLVRGVISESGGSQALTKEGTGELILLRASSYSGLTTVDQGILTAENNFALGGGGTIKSAGARVIGQATLQLAVDPTNGSSLTINEPLQLNGPGSNGQGALTSASGADIWQGIITLVSDASVGANQGSTLSLGDPTTGAGTVKGVGGLTKAGRGTVILPNANSYLGTTLVLAGVLDVQDSQSLGGVPPTFSVQAQAGTIVATGAALWFDGVRQRDHQGGITISEPLTLAGTGLNVTGALYNLSGTNLLSGDIALAADTYIGVASAPGAPNGSELTVSGDIGEVTSSRALRKVGAGRLIVAGYNRYSGPTEVIQGIVTVAGSNALGTTDQGAVVDYNASLELKGGVQVLNKALTLSGPGVRAAGALASVSDDNRWTGKITFVSNVTIGAAANSRLTLRGNISDGSHGFGLTKAGAGNLVLGGVNVYGGGTLIQAGIVNIQNNAALGSAASNTRVQAGASLELQAGVSVSGQKLTVSGNGTGTAEALPGGGGWFPVGPAAISNGSTGVAGAKTAIVSGRVTGIATDPHDANLIYITTGAGGVWRTKNGGLSWAPLTDSLPTLFTNAIAIAPSDPNTIYVGTGNPDWNSNSFTSKSTNTQFYGEGVLKSTDGGATWTLITGNAGLNEFAQQEIERILVDPSDPNFVYVATAEQAVNGLQSNQSGIWQSTDGGTTWVNTTAGQIMPPTFSSTTSAFTDLVFDPASLVASNDKLHRHILAAIGTAGGDPANGLWDSADSATTWTFNTSFPSATTDGVIRLAVSPNPNVAIMYASLAKSDGTLDQVVVSSDNGLTWAKVGGTVGDYLVGQGYFDSVIAEDPRNPSIVYVGGTSANKGTDFLESADGGANWSQIDLGVDGNGPHTNHHALAFDAFGRLLDGNDGGIWRLDLPTITPKVAVRWTDITSNLQVTQLNSIAINPQNPNLIYAGTQDNGFIKFTGPQASGALGWQQLRSGDSGQVGIDPSTPNRIYQTFAFTQAAFFQRSEDGGLTFAPKVTGINTIASKTPDNANYYVPFEVDPAIPNRLVLGTDRVYESFNRGDLWKPLSTPGQDGWNSTAPIDAIAAAPSNLNVIYAAAGGKLFVTFTHGKGVGGQQGWTEVDIGDVGRISQIWVDPLTPTTAYAVRSTFDSATMAGRVFKTVTGGQNWQDISGNLPNLPVWSILVDPRPNLNIVYVGTDAGVYSTTDFGQGTFQWQTFGANLPNAQVRQIILDPVRDFLIVATYGRGVWALDLNSPQANAGAVRGITGANTWGGSVSMIPSSRGLPIISNDTSSFNVTVGADFGASLTFSGLLSDSLSNTGLTKTGPGKVILQSGNSYGGPTVVNLGTLSVQTQGALGTSQNVTVNKGGSLELNGDQMTFAQHLQLQGPGGTLIPNPANTGALVSINGSNTWSGKVTLAGDASLNSGSNAQLVITGVIDDNGPLTGSQGFSITKEGPGEVVLSNANSYSGNTVVNGGDVNVQNVQALGTGKGTITVANGAALWLQFPAGAGVQVPLGNQVIPANVMTSETLHLSGAGLFNSGALRNVSGNNAWPGAVILDNSAAIGVDDDGSGLTVDGGSPLTLTGAINDGIVGPAGLTKVGAGTLVLTGDNSYSGGTDVAVGVLNVQQAQALGSPQVGFGTVVEGGAALELQFIDAQPGQPTTLAAQPLFLIGSGLGGGGALRNVSGDNIWSGTIALADSSSIGVEPDPHSPGAPLTLTVTGDIVGSLGNDLTKAGGGTLILPTVNDYEGQTIVAGGALQIQDPGALGLGDSVSVNDGASLQLAAGANGPFTVTGPKLQLVGAGVGGLGALQNLSGNNTWSSPIILHGDATINVAAAGNTLTITSTISELSLASGSGLFKNGPGTLVYTGGTGSDPSYTGLTTVQEGTLVVDGVIAGALLVSGGSVGGTGSVLLGITVDSGGTLIPASKLTVGTASTNANFDMATGSSYRVHFAGAGGFNALLVNGDVNLNSDGLGGATLAGAVDAGFTSAVGDSFTIIETTGTLTGTFFGLANGQTTTIGGLTFKVTYTSNSVQLTRV
jgi:autotransporter-associated beta strand protein